MSDNTTDPRYYDPETGRPTLACVDAVLRCTTTPMRDKADAARADDELARLQRELDEAVAECDRVRTEWEKCECAWHDELNAMAGDLSTERAARERAETVVVAQTALLSRLRNILAECKAQTRFGTDDPETLRKWECEAWAVVSQAYHAMDQVSPDAETCAGTEQEACNGNY
jgi:uncharacterized membrane protein YccC